VPIPPPATPQQCSLSSFLLSGTALFHTSPKLANNPHTVSNDALANSVNETKKRDRRADCSSVERDRMGESEIRRRRIGDIIQVLRMEDIVLECKQRRMIRRGWH